MTGKAAVLLHALHRKVLDHDHVKILHKTCGQLFDEILAAILNALVDLGNTLSLPLPVIRAFLLPGELLLFASEAVIFVLEPARIPDFLAGRERHETFDAQVYSDKLKIAVFSVDSREKMGFLCADEADVVLACGILRDGAATRLRRKLSGPPDVDQTRHLREAELPLAVFFSDVEGRADIPGGLIALLRFEGGILSPALEEVGERLIQIAKTLLKRDGTDLRQPLGLFLFLLGGETTGQVSERKRLLVLVVRLRLRLKRPVVHPPATPERTGEFSLLRLAWIQAVSVCALDFVGHTTINKRYSLIGFRERNHEKGLLAMSHRQAGRLKPGVLQAFLALYPIL